MWEFKDYFSLSGPFFEITNFKLFSPKIGTLSLPVQKNRNFFFSSSENSCSTSQKILKNHILHLSIKKSYLTVFEFLIYPSIYLVAFSSSKKSYVGDPQIIILNSSAFNN